MKRSYNSLFFAIFYLVCLTQTRSIYASSPSKIDSSKLLAVAPEYLSEISLKTNYILDSRGIGNKSIYDYFMGKYFTKDDINLLNRNLRSTSVLGQDFTTDIIDTRKKYFLNDIHYGFRSHFDGSIGKDLAGLASRGNAPYAGRDLVNTNLLFHSSSWHKVGVTFAYYKKRYSFPTFLASVNYVSGNKYTYINLTNTQVFTQQNGDYIDAKWNADYRSSITNNLVGFGGSGTSIDLKYHGFIESKKIKRPFIIDLQIIDLGFISWNRYNKNLSWDSSLRFSGIDVGNITAITSKSYTDNLSDSLKNILNAHYNYVKNNSILPAIFLLKVSKWYQSKYKMYAQIDYMIHASYKPQITLGAEVYKGSHALVPQMRFGGYGDFNIDLSYIYKSKYRKWQFSSKLYSVEALIAPKYQSGLGLSIQTSYKF